MGTFDIRDFMKEASAASDAAGDPSAAKPPTPLSPLAERLATLPVKPTYSPVVLCGTVRLVEFCIVAVTGFAIHRLYLPPQSLDVVDALFIPGLAALTVVVLQAIGAYHVSAF